MPKAANKFRARASALIILSLWSLIFGRPAVSEKNLKEWHCSARIEVKGPERYKGFFLNERIYENSRPDLADLRIVDQKNEFVPYYMIKGYSTKSENKTYYNSQLIKRFKQDGKLFFDFRITPLLKTADIMGNQLKLDLPEQNFLKIVEVYGSYDGNDWEKVTNDQLYRIDGLIKDEIKLGDVEKYTYYRIILPENTDNIRLSVLQLIYLNVQEDWTVFQRSSRLEYKITNKSNDTIVTISNPQHLKVGRIVLAAPGNFRREYQIFDNPEMKRPLKRGAIYNLKFQDLNISDTEIDMADSPCSAPVIILKIFNNDNRPLQFTKLYTDYYIDQIIFEAPGPARGRDQGLWLYFGNPQANPPVYDLSFVKFHILKEPLAIVNLTDFKITKLEATPLESKEDLHRLFNIVIIVIALLLIIFLIRKLNIQRT